MPPKVAVESQESLKPLEWIALKILAKEADKHRGEVQEGRSQRVDFMLRVSGDIHVSADGQQTRSKKPSPELLLGHVAAFLAERGLESEWTAFCQRMTTLATENSGAVPEVPAMTQVFATAAASLVTALSPKNTIPVKGQTRGEFRVGLVDVAAIQQTSNHAVTTALNELRQHTRMLSLEA